MWVRVCSLGDALGDAKVLVIFLIIIIFGHKSGAMLCVAWIHVLCIQLERELVEVLLSHLPRWVFRTEVSKLIILTP